MGPEVLEMCHEIALHTINPLEYFLKKGISVIFWPRRPREMLFLTKDRFKKINQSFSGIHFDMIHVFRLYMVPYVKDVLELNSRQYLQLDLDDIESITRRRLSELYELNGERRISGLVGLEASQYEEMEREQLPLFDQVFVCSEVDKSKIYEKYKYDHVKVVPNIIGIPNSRKHECKSAIFNFLFVGSLGYYPNRDAAIFFCDQILPIIRKHAPMAFSFKIVGMDAPKKFVYYLSKFPEVDLIGPVVDTGPIYEYSDAVVIPIRAGGGTRIKALEAFAYRKPVISTSVGVEGIPVNHEQHILIGDTAEDFARQCVRVMKDSSIGRNMVENSFSLVQSSYNFEVIRERLCKK